MKFKLFSDILHNFWIFCCNLKNNQPLILNLLTAYHKNLRNSNFFKLSSLLVNHFILLLYSFFIFLPIYLENFLLPLHFCLSLVFIFSFWIELIMQITCLLCIFNFLWISIFLSFLVYLWCQLLEFILK